MVPALAAWLLRGLISNLELGAAGEGTARVLWALGAALSAGGFGLMLELTHYLDTILKQRVSLAVTQALFGKMNRLPGLAHFEDPQFHTQLVLAETAAAEAPQLITQLVMTLLRVVSTVATLLGVVFVVSSVLGGLLLVCGLLGVLAQWVRSRADLKMFEVMTEVERWRQFYRSLLLDARAAKEIRLLNIGGLLLGRLHRALSERGRTERAIQRRTLAVQAVLAITAMLLAALGAVVISRGRFALGDVTLFFAAVVGIQEAFIGALSMLALSGRALSLFNSYRQILALPERDATGALPGPLRREIRFEDVWFRYHPDGPWVLAGVNLVIPAGSCVGLVGVNGAGKTTLVKLLCRFYDPDRGRILWDDVDLKTVARHELYARLGATFQDFMEYELSAAENIGLGDTSHGFDLQRIRAAARRVDLDHVLAALPNGYATLLTKRLSDPEPGGGSRGVVLSGGEWQRVAVARCLLRDDADVVILDEPSSGLDAEAEHRLHQTLQHHARDKTRLLISHRLSSLRGAHSIVVLANGVVAECRSHDMLMAAGREYARLFSLQATGYQDPWVAAR